MAPLDDSSADLLSCSFCGKSQQQVEKLIGGRRGVFICDECVAVCAEIIESERNAGRS